MVFPPKFGSCSSSFVFTYLFWVTLVFLYLGTLVLTSQLEDHPPSFGLPRIIFMVAVAILVERREGLSFGLGQTHSLLFETVFTITGCNLAMKMVWDQIEKIIHILLVILARAVESASGLALACRTCGSFHPLQFIFTTGVAASLLSWVLYSVSRHPPIDRGDSQCWSGGEVRLRFWHLVEVRFINPLNHIPERCTLQNLTAPSSAGRNPVILSSLTK